ELRLIKRNGLRRILVLSVALFSGWLTIRAHGIMFWLTLCSAVFATLWFLDGLFKMIQEFVQIKTGWLQVREITMLTVSIGMTLMIAEAGLTWYEKFRTTSEVPSSGNETILPFRGGSDLSSLLINFSVAVPEDVLNKAARRQALLTMPQEWERRPV